MGQQQKSWMEYILHPVFFSISCLHEKQEWQKLTLVTFIIGSQGEAWKTMTSSISALRILWAFIITILWNTKFRNCNSFFWVQMIMLMTIMFIVLSLSVSLKSGFSNYCWITNIKVTTTTNHRDKSKQCIGKIKIPSLPVVFSKRVKSDASKVRLVLLLFLIGWKELAWDFKPITKCCNRNRAITFDSHLKTAL